MFEKIDLHMHTTVSDGTDTPAEILSRVRDAGLDLFAVTDHDAVKGCAIIQELRTDPDPVFLTGVEFSCRDDEGMYHILGYGYDPGSEPIRRIVETGHRFRVKKIRSRLDFLRTVYGFCFPQEEILALLALDNPGKPHIGNLMVKYGYAKTREEAIKKYINQIHFQNEYVSPGEAIEGIIAGGGIPVLAHPIFGNGDQMIPDEEMEQRLRRLKDFGLRGIEAFYSGFTAKMTRWMLELAERYDLYITAGSDYHGTNKPIRPGDTGLEKVSDYPEGLKKFLSAVMR